MWIRTPFVAISIYSGGDGRHRGAENVSEPEKGKGVGIHVGFSLSASHVSRSFFGPVVMIWSARSIETLVDGLLSLSMCLSIHPMSYQSVAQSLASAVVVAAVQLVRAVGRLTSVGVLSLLWQARPASFLTSSGMSPGAMTGVAWLPALEGLGFRLSAPVSPRTWPAQFPPSPGGSCRRYSPWHAVGATPRRPTRAASPLSPERSPKSSAVVVASHGRPCPHQTTPSVPRREGPRTSSRTSGAVDRCVYLWRLFPEKRHL